MYIYIHTCVCVHVFVCVCVIPFDIYSMYNPIPLILNKSQYMREYPTKPWFLAGMCLISYMASTKTSTILKECVYYY